MSKKNVAVFVPFVHWPTHFATDLELMQRHLDAGDRITVLVCNGDLPSCDVNMLHDTSRCAECIRIRGAGLGLLSDAVTVTDLASLAPPDTGLTLPPEWRDQAEVRQFSVDGFDVGMAALSSLIFFLRDADPDLRRHAPLLNRLIGAGYQVFRAAHAFLDRHGVDRLYVFNTRFATTRGVMRACAEAGVECLVHERGCDLNHYELFPNTFPHDRAFVDRDIRTRWRSAALDDTGRRAIAERWYRNKAIGVETYERAFVGGQRPGLLPETWSRVKRNVVIFTSSEDEFAAVGEEWGNPVYENELAGVCAIAESAHGGAWDSHLFVRVHPNLSGIDNRQTRGLRELRSPAVTVVPPDSPVSTYAMLQSADAVLTFGSTVGIEAVFWGVPSVLAGMSFYRDLGGTYNPGSHAEVMLLLSSRLAPRPVEAALMYGYYWSTFGTRFGYYEPEDYDTGRFKGRNIWRETGHPDTPPPLPPTSMNPRV